MFELDLLRMKRRFHEQEGFATSAFSILTKNVIVIDSDVSIVYLIMQPCFGCGNNEGRVGLNDCNQFVYFIHQLARIHK